MKPLCLLITCLSLLTTTAIAYSTPCGIKKLPSIQMEYCLYGSKKPTLVFIGPMGSDMSVWPRPFLKRLEAFSTVLIYNRVGYGKSQLLANNTNQTVTAQSVAEQLHALVVALNIHQPIVLVAHSIGGVYGLYYAKHYPVSGLVMIDADGSHEPKINSPFQSKIPPTPGSMDAKETAGFNTSMDQVNEAPSFPAIPLLVITATNHGSNATVEQQWLALQKGIVALSPKAKQVIANGSGHFVYVDQPNLVVSEIHAFVSDMAK